MFNCYFCNKDCLADCSACSEHLIELRREYEDLHAEYNYDEKLKSYYQYELSGDKVWTNGKGTAILSNAELTSATPSVT